MNFTHWNFIITDRVILLYAKYKYENICITVLYNQGHTHNLQASFAISAQNFVHNLCILLNDSESIVTKNVIHEKIIIT